MARVYSYLCELEMNGVLSDEVIGRTRNPPLRKWRDISPTACGVLQLHTNRSPGQGMEWDKGVICKLPSPIRE